MPQRCPRVRCAQGSGVSSHARADNSQQQEELCRLVPDSREPALVMWAWVMGAGAGLSGHWAHSSLDPAHPRDVKRDPGPLWCQMRQWKYSIINLIPASASSFFS